MASCFRGCEWLGGFMDSRFTCWCPQDLNDLTGLVVDGPSVCAHLYSQLLSQHKSAAASWLLGGEYLSFHSAVKEFFSELLFTGVKVHVMLGSLGAPEGEFPAVETVHSRLTKANKLLMQAQGLLGRQDAQKAGFMPVMVTSVFVDVLQRLDVELHVSTSGVGSRETAALANHHKCPVLGADPDFFMFELECGYMPVDKLSTVIANGMLYRTADFQKQFGLKDSKLRLILPLLHGNAFIRGLKVSEDLEQALKEASKCESYQDYLASKDEGTAKSFETVDKFYCDMHLASSNSSAIQSNCSDLPEWLIRKSQEGHLESQLLNIHTLNSYTLGTVVEDIRKDSAWLTSRPIRQLVYGFMGVAAETNIKEIVRAKSSAEVIDVFVCPSNFDPPMHVREFSEKGKRALSSVVLKSLGCDKISQCDIEQEFEILEDQWKLPVAATFYWYRACDNPPAQRHLVKSLLLSFLLCSGDLNPATAVTSEPVTRENRSDHMTALHVFAQWQCVYHDALTLNHLVRGPFFSTSPAFLFSGRAAMHYASYARKNQSLDSVVARGTKAWELYNRFLYLITGCDAEGRRGGHAKHQPKPKAPPQVRDQAPRLSDTNRYALLSDTELQ